MEAATRQTLKPRRSPRLIAGLLVVLAADVCSAHPISLTEASVHVTQTQVIAKLEVFVEDLFLFHNLKPNDRDFLEPDAIRAGTEKHRQFLLDRFAIRDRQGERLTSSSAQTRPLEIPPEGIRLADLMAYKLTYEFQYALAAPPEFLTFSQSLADETLAVPAEFRLRVKPEGAEAPHQGLLKAGEPQTLRFTWDRPPLSPAAAEEERQQWYARQQEETLGITSYSSVYSFLYIEDYEVRHEVLIPLLTLEQSVLIARTDDAFLEVGEQETARPQIEAFFAASNPLEIDGVAIKPVVPRVDFYGLDFKDFASRAEPRRVSLANARVGVILTYSSQGPPASVKLTWNRFNRYLWTVNTVVYAYDQTLKKTLSRVGMDNVLEWQRPDDSASPAPPPNDLRVPDPPRWSLPLATLGSLAAVVPTVWLLRRWGVARRNCWFVVGLFLGGAVALSPHGRWSVRLPWAGPSPLTAGHAQTIFGALHKNMYRAFDFRSESDVYDALARSVDGPLLRKLYLQIRRGLEMQEQGGAVSRIREVVIQDGQLQPLPANAGHDPRGFGFRCRWTVSGTIEHWGHIHARTNQYEALFTVEPRDQVWKITALEILNEQRLKLETKVRGL